MRTRIPQETEGFGDPDTVGPGLWAVRMGRKSIFILKALAFKREKATPGVAFTFFELAN